MNLNKKQLYLANADFTFYPQDFGSDKSVSPVGKYELFKKSNLVWIDDDDLYPYVYYIRKNSVGSDVVDYNHWVIGRNQNNHNFYIYYSGEKINDHSNPTKLYAIGEEREALADIYLPTGWQAPDIEDKFEILFNDSMYQQWGFSMGKCRLDYKITGGVDVIYKEELPEFFDKDYPYVDGWEVQIDDTDGPFLYYISNEKQQNHESTYRVSDSQYIRISRYKAESIFDVNFEEKAYFFVKKREMADEGHTFSVREYDIAPFETYEASLPPPYIPPSQTRTPSVTPTVTPTTSITPTISVTPSLTKTPNASPDPTQTITPTISFTSTPTPSITETPAPPNAIRRDLFNIGQLGSNLFPLPSPSPTATPSTTPTRTPSRTPTNTLTPTKTSSVTATPTVTTTVTPTSTISITPTVTPTITPTITPTTSTIPVLGWNLRGRVNSKENDLAGYDVAINESGNIFAVSYPNAFTSNGYVQVYQRSGDYNLIIGSAISGVTVSGQMGTAISLSADAKSIAIGSQSDSDTQNSLNKCGSVKVYDYDENLNSWSQAGQTIFGENSFDQIGKKGQVTISQDGNVLALSNPVKNSNEGGVKVYQRNQISSSNFQWNLKGSEITDVGGKYFGQQIDLDYIGNNIIVCSENPQINNFVRGYHDQEKSNVKVFQYNNTDWNLVNDEIKKQKDFRLLYDFPLRFFAITGSNSNILSYASRISNEYTSIFLTQDPNAQPTGFMLVASGSQQADEILDTGITGSGSYITGIIEQSIAKHNSISFVGDYSGFNLSLNNFHSVASSASISNDGNTIAIGSRSSFIGNNSNAGHIEVYENKNNQWQQVGNDITGDRFNAQFGYNVKLGGSGDLLIVSSPMYDTSILPDNGGRGFFEVYQNYNNDWQKIYQTITGQSEYQKMGFSLDVAVSGEEKSIIVGSPFSSNSYLDGFNFEEDSGGRINKIKTEIYDLHIPDPTPTSTITPTVTPTITDTPVTPTLTPTSSTTPTVTPTITVTSTISETPSVTPTVTPTNTVTPTVTNTSTVTPTVTPTKTTTPTVTSTPTSTATVTPTNTITPTATVTPSLPACFPVYDCGTSEPIWSLIENKIYKFFDDATQSVVSGYISGSQRDINNNCSYVMKSGSQSYTKSESEITGISPFYNSALTEFYGISTTGSECSHLNPDSPYGYEFFVATGVGIDCDNIQYQYSGYWYGTTNAKPTGSVSFDEETLITCGKTDVDCNADSNANYIKVNGFYYEIVNVNYINYHDCTSTITWYNHLLNCQNVTSYNVPNDDIFTAIPAGDNWAHGESCTNYQINDQVYMSLITEGSSINIPVSNYQAYVSYNNNNNSVTLGAYPDYWTTDTPGIAGTIVAIDRGYHPTEETLYRIEFENEYEQAHSSANQTTKTIYNVPESYLVQKGVDLSSNCSNGKPLFSDAYTDADYVYYDGGSTANTIGTILDCSHYIIDHGDGYPLLKVNENDLTTTDPSSGGGGSGGGSSTYSVNDTVFYVEYDPITYMVNYISARITQVNGNGTYSISHNWYGSCQTYTNISEGDLQDMDDTGSPPSTSC